MSAAFEQSVVFDPLGRVSQISNLLGVFNLAYVNSTARLDHILYPNGQRTNYTYWPNVAASAGNGDQRLRKIENLLPGGANASTFEYTFDLEGIIQTWSKQFDANAALTSNFQYDLTDQLSYASVPSAPTVSKESYWRYDRAGNRTSEQIDNASSAYTVNRLNQVTAISGSGPIHFEGSVSEPAHVFVNTTKATRAADNTFQADAPLPSGTQTVTVTATDASGNTCAGPNCRRRTRRDCRRRKIGRFSTL